MNLTTSTQSKDLSSLHHILSNPASPSPSIHLLFVPHSNVTILLRIPPPLLPFSLTTSLPPPHVTIHREPLNRTAEALQFSPLLCKLRQLGGYVAVCWREASGGAGRKRGEGRIGEGGGGGGSSTREMAVGNVVEVRMGGGRRGAGFGMTHWLSMTAGM